MCVNIRLNPRETHPSRVSLQEFLHPRVSVRRKAPIGFAYGGIAKGGIRTAQNNWRYDLSVVFQRGISTKYKQEPVSVFVFWGVSVRAVSVRRASFHGV